MKPTYRIVANQSMKAGYWWTLKAASNGKNLAHSEVYNTRRAMLATARKLAAALGITVEE